jgi:hypothetical protein
VNPFYVYALIFLSRRSEEERSKKKVRRELSGIGYSNSCEENKRDILKRMNSYISKRDPRIAIGLQADVARIGIGLGRNSALRVRV